MAQPQSSPYSRLARIDSLSVPSRSVRLVMSRAASDPYRLRMEATAQL